MNFTVTQKRIILGVVIILVLFFVLITSSRQKKPTLTTLTIWALEDDYKTFEPILKQFQRYYPYIKFNYVLKNPETFEEDYIKALADNNPPDIFMIYDSWVPTYWNRIGFLDLSKEKDFNVFYIQQNYPENITSVILAQNRYLLGIPLYIDTLALYYNGDYFNYFNIPLPPKNWQEVIALIPKLRKINEKGQLTRSAIALGSIDNIEHLKDILAMFLFNYGNKIIASGKKALLKENSAKQAIEFYLQFSDFKSPNYTYNENLDNSLKSFADGRTAMVLGYYTDQKIIQNYNPQLNYKVTYLPYFSSPTSKINYPKSLIVVVSNRSRYFNQAWAFLKFLSQRETANLYYSLTGKPPARRDLIAFYLNDPKTGIFIQQILTSRFFYQFNEEKVTEIFKTLLREIVYQNYPIDKALSRANDRFEFLWQQSQY